MENIKDFVPNTEGFKVKTPDGFKSFKGVALMGNKPIVRVDFSNGSFLECTGNHRVFRLNGKPVEVAKLKPNTKVLCAKGHTTKVTKVQLTGRVEPVYDLIEVDGGHRYYTNGILSHNCEFVTDDQTMIDPMCLARLNYIEPIFYTGQVRWFKEPEPNKSYLIGLDPCLGTGGDYAAIQVFELPGMVQVAEWQHNKTPPRGQVRLLLHILTLLDSELREHPDQDGEPELYWSVENNTLGEAVLQVIEDTGEHIFPGRLINEKRKPGTVRRFRKGLTTTNRTKLSACSKFKSLVESDRMLINSQQLLRQLKSFVNSGASFAAKSGEHDDLVMATVLCVRMLEIVIKWMDGDDAEALKETITNDDDFDEPMPTLIG